MIFYEKSLLFANEVVVFTHIVVSLFVYRLWMIMQNNASRGRWCIPFHHQKLLILAATFSNRYLCNLHLISANIDTF